MKYLAAFSGALFVTILLQFIQAIFNIAIDDFLAGWFSCIGWFMTMRIYEDFKKIQNQCAQ